MLLLDEDDEPLLDEPLLDEPLDPLPDDEDDEPLLDEPLDPLPESVELLGSVAPVMLIWNDWVALKLPSEA